MDGLVALGNFVMVVALTLGPVGAWLALLNRRDRRQARLLGAVLDQVGSRDLRGRVAVRVRCGMLSRRSAAAVHISGASRDEIWEVIGRLARHLPSSVRLEVTGWVDGGALPPVTVGTTTRAPLPRPPKATFATS
ncbi:MAG: hypothetical protein HY724_04555 [Candidatus Rokubacteria bacterium]|nr:hypothetical protein [Candidatus Rokubacteria bacterium]